MNGIFLLGLDGSSLIDGISNDVHNSAKSFRADRDADRCSGINNILASDQSLGGIHGDGSHSWVS